MTSRRANAATHGDIAHEMAAATAAAAHRAILDVCQLEGLSVDLACTRVLATRSTDECATRHHPKHLSNPHDGRDRSAFHPT